MCLASFDHVLMPIDASVSSCFPVVSASAILALLAYSLDPAVHLHLYLAWCCITLIHDRYSSTSPLEASLPARSSSSSTTTSFPRRPVSHAASACRLQRATTSQADIMTLQTTSDSSALVRTATATMAPSSTVSFLSEPP